MMQTVPSLSACILKKDPTKMHFGWTFFSKHHSRHLRTILLETAVSKRQHQDAGPEDDDNC
jgi:hypothetical protein